jgi:adenine-specific DNA glycosylase
VLLVRRQPGELLAGTWALPAAEVAEGVPAQDAARAAASAHGVVTREPAIFRGRVRHVFTHRDLTADVFSVGEARRTRHIDGADDPDRRWVARDDLASLGISSFTRKTLAAGTQKADKRREPP